MEQLGIQYHEKGDTIEDEGLVFENWDVSTEFTTNINDLLV